MGSDMVRELTSTGLLPMIYLLHSFILSLSVSVSVVMETNMTGSGGTTRDMARGP
jgi:hypothetical protein